MTDPRPTSASRLCGAKCPNTEFVCGEPSGHTGKHSAARRGDDGLFDGLAVWTDRQRTPPRPTPLPPAPSEPTPEEDLFAAFTSKPCNLGCGRQRDWALDGQLQAVCYRCGNPPPSPGARTLEELEEIADNSNSRAEIRAAFAEMRAASPGAPDLAALRTLTEKWKEAESGEIALLWFAALDVLHALRPALLLSLLDAAGARDAAVRERDELRLAAQRAVLNARHAATCSVYAGSLRCDCGIDKLAIASRTPTTTEGRGEAGHSIAIEGSLIHPDGPFHLGGSHNED